MGFSELLSNISIKKAISFLLLALAAASASACHNYQYCPLHPDPHYDFDGGSPGFPNVPSPHKILPFTLAIRMAPHKFDHFWKKVRLLAQPFTRCDGGILKSKILKP